MSSMEKVREMVWQNLKLAVGGLDREKQLDIMLREFNLKCEKDVAKLNKEELITLYGKTDSYVNYKMV